MLGLFLGVGLLGVSAYQKRRSFKPVSVDGDVAISQKPPTTSSGSNPNSDEPSIRRFDSGTSLCGASAKPDFDWVIDPALAVSYDRDSYSRDAPFFHQASVGKPIFPTTGQLWRLLRSLSNWSLSPITNLTAGRSE